MRRVLAALLSILFLLVGVLTFLLWPMGVPDDCPPPVDWHEIRNLAQALPGDKPREVRVEHVLTLSMPAPMTMAGSGFGAVEMDVYAYQLTFPDRMVVLDAAMPLEQTQGLPVKHYDQDAWHKVAQALDRASAVYVTHEHSDHIGGLFEAGHPHDSHAILTPEQLTSPKRTAPAVIPEASHAGFKTLSYDRYKALAPGVVAIKAAGHTPGSQWFFIARADGTELLLVGDTAWHMDNIEQQQGPPRLTSLMLDNDRRANACQLAQLHALLAREPALHVMPGHDAPQAQKLLAQGVLTAGFL